MLNVRTVDACSVCNTHLQYKNYALVFGISAVITNSTLYVGFVNLKRYMSCSGLSFFLLSVRFSVCIFVGMAINIFFCLYFWPVLLKFFARTVSMSLFFFNVLVKLINSIVQWVI